MLYVDASSIVKAEGGGSIVAQNNGLIIGNGTFKGAGVIEGGGHLQPGGGLGTMTWDGNLAVQSGGTLEVEIAGMSAGTQYDRINVSGSFTLNGSLAVKVLNGFQPQQSDVFDVVIAQGGVSAVIAGTRLDVLGSYGSFEIQLVGGNTLRLHDFQMAPATYDRWKQRFGLTGAGAEPTADFDNDGLSNLLEYAMGTDPTQSSYAPISSGRVSIDGKEYLSLTYLRPSGAELPSDVLYEPQRSSVLDPDSWSASPSDVVIHGINTGPPPFETVTIRSNHPFRETGREFMRLRLSIAP